MDLTSAAQLLAGAVAASNDQGQRYEWGRWDGSRLWLDSAPDRGLGAENAAGPLTPGQRVLAMLLHRRWIMIGPSATTLEARIAQLETWRSRTAPASAAGEFVEPDGGPTVSYIAFPAGRFLRPPVVTVTLMGGAGSHTWDTPRVLEVFLSGFRLFTRNGAGARFAWHAVEPH